MTITFSYLYNSLMRMTSIKINNKIVPTIKGMSIYLLFVKMSRKYYLLNRSINNVYKLKKRRSTAIDNIRCYGEREKKEVANSFEKLKVPSESIAIAKITLESKLHCERKKTKQYRTIANVQYYKSKSPFTLSNILSLKLSLSYLKRKIQKKESTIFTIAGKIRISNAKCLESKVKLNPCDPYSGV